MADDKARTTPGVRITYKGKLAWTVRQIAERYNKTESGVRTDIERLKLVHAAVLNGKVKLYLASDVEAAMKARPGSGWRAGTGAGQQADPPADSPAGNP